MLAHMRNLGVLLIVCGAAASAQTADGPYQRMLESREQATAYLESEARAITDVAIAEVSDRRSWEAVRDGRRREMREMLGLDPEPARTPLNIQITGRIERPGYVIEKIAFESLPKVYVTGNLYIPEGADKKPAVIYVCGHAPSPHGAKTVYQRHGHTLAKHGYVAFILDPIQIAETFAMHHGVYNQDLYDWYSRGYSPAGVEIWNVIRALDYLETRPEVDASRFGITGRSGGAAMSWFAAAVDERLQVAAPVMGISTYAATVEANATGLHCDCMFPVNGPRHDLLHQGALIAPRALMMAHGIQDPLFPVPGYKEFEQAIGGLFASYDRPDRFTNVEVDTGHEDSDYLRATATAWFDKHLAHVPEREIDVAFEEVPPADLAVFGGRPPADALNYRVHELFVPERGLRAPASLAEWLERREELSTQLREKVFGGFPEDPEPATLEASDLEAPGGFKAVTIETEPGIELTAWLREPEEARGPSLVYIVSDGEDWEAARRTIGQSIQYGRRPILALYPRGVGEVAWPKSVWKTIQRNAMLVGRTVDSMRLWDVLQAADAMRRRTGYEVVVAGSGVSGALGLYAAALDDGIAQAILLDAPTTHAGGRETAGFLNVLRYTDLPEAAALVAPRRVTFYGRQPGAYAFTRRIFDLYGQGDRMRLTMTIEGALEGRFDHDFSSGL